MPTLASALKLFKNNLGPNLKDFSEIESNHWFFKQDLPEELIADILIAFKQPGESQTYEISENAAFLLSQPFAQEKLIGNFEETFALLKLNVTPDGKAILNSVTGKAWLEKYPNHIYLICSTNNESLFSPIYACDGRDLVLVVDLKERFFLNATAIYLAQDLGFRQFLSTVNFSWLSQQFFQDVTTNQAMLLLQLFENNCLPREGEEIKKIFSIEQGLLGPDKANFVAKGSIWYCKNSFVQECVNTNVIKINDDTASSLRYQLERPEDRTLLDYKNRLWTAYKSFDYLEMENPRQRRSELQHLFDAPPIPQLILNVLDKPGVAKVIFSYSLLYVYLFDIKTLEEQKVFTDPTLQKALLARRIDLILYKLLIRAKFIHAFQQYIKDKPQGDKTATLKTLIADLRTGKSYEASNKAFENREFLTSGSLYKKYLTEMNIETYVFSQFLGLPAYTPAAAPSHRTTLAVPPTNGVNAGSPAMTVAGSSKTNDLSALRQDTRANDL